MNHAFTLLLLHLTGWWINLQICQKGIDPFPDWCDSPWLSRYPSGQECYWKQDLEDTQSSWCVFNFPIFRSAFVILAYDVNVIFIHLQGLAPEIPEDLYHLIKKAVAIRKHLERNRKDKDSKFRLILVESRIHRLARYYKKTKKLPPVWK